MSNEYFEPAQANHGEALSKVILLLIGLFVGIVVTFVYCGAIGMMNKGPGIAHVGGPGAAHGMENLPNSGPIQVPDQQEPAYDDQAVQLGMQQSAPSMMQAPQGNYIQTGTPLMMPDQMPQTQTYMQAAPTTLYPGQMMDDPAHQIGRNGLRANPCVDPPSCRGRAYSQPLQ